MFSWLLFMIACLSEKSQTLDLKYLKSYNIWYPRYGIAERRLIVTCCLNYRVLGRIYWFLNSPPGSLEWVTLGKIHLTDPVNLIGSRGKVRIDSIVLLKFKKPCTSRHLFIYNTHLIADRILSHEKCFKLRLDFNRITIVCSYFSWTTHPK